MRVITSVDDPVEFDPNTTGNVRVVHVQSADPDDMQRRVLDAISDPAHPTDELCLIDIGGGGDGHTFVCRLMFATPDQGAGLTAANVRVLFYLAAEADAIYAARRAKQAEIASFFGTPPLGQVTMRQTGLAGASQGTRFMGMLVVDLTQAQ